MAAWLSILELGFYEDSGPGEPQAAVHPQQSTRLFEGLTCGSLARPQSIRGDLNKI